MSINNCDYDFNKIISPECSVLKKNNKKQKQRLRKFTTLSSSSLNKSTSFNITNTNVPSSSEITTTKTTTKTTTTISSSSLVPLLTTASSSFVTSSMSLSSLTTSSSYLSLQQRCQQQQQQQQQQILSQKHKFESSFSQRRFLSSLLILPLRKIHKKCFTTISKNLISFHFLIIIMLLEILMATPNMCYGLLIVDPNGLENSGGSGLNNQNLNSAAINGGSSGIGGGGGGGGNVNSGSSSSNSNSGTNGGSTSNVVSSIGGGGHYLDKLDKLERSVAAVLIKVAYGTTSTTKRSIPDNSYVPSLTTIATPPLTTLRYLEKTQHQQQLNLHHRNYELDLERDHALPTSAPNADILKSNSNPLYPNPNRHHNHDRDRHRHVLNSTPVPSIHNLLRKGQPTIPMYPGDMPSYSPPARAFFTPPLPPEYQSPFADKPTLRGTNNDAGIISGGAFINRRPIPPPSLMPGHERIPLRPPDLNGSGNGGSNEGGIPILPDGSGGGNSGGSGNIGGVLPPSSSSGNVGVNVPGAKNYGGEDGQRKKALNTPSQKVSQNTGSGTDNYGGSGTSGRNSAGGNLDVGSNGVNDTSPGIGISAGSGTGSGGGGRLHFPSISRILSGSNGRKEEIPEVLLRKVTDKPNLHHHHSPVQQQPSSDGGRNQNINQNRKNGANDYDENFDGVQINGENVNAGGGGQSQPSSDEDNFDIFTNGGDQDEPKTQPKIKMSTKSTENPGSGSGAEQQPQSSSSGVYSTQVIHNLANINNEKSLLLTTSVPNRNNGGSNIGGTSSKDSSSSSSSSNNSGTGSNTNNNNNNNGNTGGTSSTSSSSTTKNTATVATWAVAWNIHVYLSAILFTILAVYSIFKIIFYDKLTHLFNQSYFICIHLILIIICTSRIFYLCYDAYNIHSTFHTFISEILLNLPATFLTISFSVLILFLLIRSLNHKNNRYSSLIRPLTVVVGSSVHVGLCITLHYVESYTTTNHQSLYYYHQQQMLYRNNYRGTSSASSSSSSSVSSSATSSSNGINIGIGGSTTTNYLLQNHNSYNQLLQPPPTPPPRVLSLICQIIYIFICLSLGLLYLYIYRILKRILRSKSQNYIHGYQNLSYAIHITIATALLFVLLAALQIYGAISISTTRPLITSQSEIDWLQWGYQFSLRLIEIAIITLISWVAGLKTGGVSSSVLQREKANDNHHNVSGFALFPCTSSSSQEHFETDYPAVCNANTNLHTYTLRTGKPIYDDNFALNSLGGGSSGGGGGGQGSSGGGSGGGGGGSGQRGLNNDFQLSSNPNEFVRSYETSSLRSGSGGGGGGIGGGGGGVAGGHHHHHHHHHHHSAQQQIDTSSSHHSDLLTDSQTDHYENPNFELRSNKPDMRMMDTCYSEPLNSGGHPSQSGGSSSVGGGVGYDFQNFERPIYGAERPNSRNDLHQHHTVSGSKMNKQIKSTNHQSNCLDRLNYDNPERRSLNSTHSCANNRNYPSYNSIERRSGVRKSGTLNNIGGTMHGGSSGGGGRNSSSSNSSLSSRPSGVQTLSSTHNRLGSGNQGSGRMSGGGGGGAGVGCVNNSNGSNTNKFYRGEKNHRSSLERSSSAAIQQFMLPSDDDMTCSGNPERTNLIMSIGPANSRERDRDGVGGVGVGGCGNGSVISSSASGGNLTGNESCSSQQQLPSSHHAAMIAAANNAATSSSSGDSATSGSMLVAEHGFVRFRALDDINNAQGVGIHNASIRMNGRNKEKRFTNNT